MIKLSTGQNSTLGEYRKIAVFYGAKAVAFIDNKIAESPKGVDEEVLTDERQMLFLLAQIEFK